MVRKQFSEGKDEIWNSSTGADISFLVLEKCVLNEMKKFLTLRKGPLVSTVVLC